MSNYSVPSRASDAGPDNALPKYCPTCDGKHPNMLGDCAGDCGDKVCDLCPGVIVTDDGIYCPLCIHAKLHEMQEREWPQLSIQQVLAKVQYPHIPEWEGK